jgi:acyl carrier protein phosphodiesterase
MNYLAHAYLSFNQPEILVGNMISDFVKGKKKFDYSLNIQKGIDLHRAIDTFTDYHEATQVAKLIFRPAYRLYSGAFIDIVYDHFLANDTQMFNDEKALLRFSTESYDTMHQLQQFFPARFAMMFPYMQKQNWLFNYKYREGIRNSFEGLVRRAQFMQESKTAFMLFEKHHEELRICYNNFFPSLKKFAFNHLQLLNAK